VNQKGLNTAMTHASTIRAAAMLALPVVALLASNHALAQYKYTTPEGKTVYSDQPPPPEARNVQQANFGSTGNSIDSSHMPYELRRAYESYPVTLYTTANCAPCDQGRGLLRARGIPFAEKTVITAEDVAIMKAQGLGERLPVLAVGSNRVPNFQESAWNIALDSAAYPKSPAPAGAFNNPAPVPLAPKPEAVKAPSAARNDTATPQAAPSDNPAGIRF
jgi:hypothetical protein